jgi:2-oxoglutarate ferredoxin oxidoreductase subunit beta
MVTFADYTGLTPAWCPGCGNFGILKALNQALVELEIEPRNLLLVSGIGQSGKLPHYTRGNVFNSLHGRPVPPASGAKIANPELVVIAVSGDGDAYGEGGNHFIHTARRNHDITYLVHNNQVYGLTKGQASPTSDAGFVTKTTPDGAVRPFNPLALAIVSGAGFVSRGFAGDSEHLTRLLKHAITHRGFSLVDILQPCVSFNRVNTYQWYRERIYKLDEIDDYLANDQMTALAKALEWGDRIPIGIIYQQDHPAYEDNLPGLRPGPPVTQPLDPQRIASLLAEFQ